jgi:hypothetical protein
MRFQSRLCRARSIYLLVLLSVLGSLAARAAEKPRMHVDDYQLTVELLPESHHLNAHAIVKVTALEDVSTATFQLNNALRVTKLVDANNKPLTPERSTQDSSIRFGLNSSLQKNSSTTFTFDYEGTLENADDSPVQGLKLAYVGPDTSYLLYSGLWFPVAGYGVNRFTSTISVTVPSHMVVIGSGKDSGPATGEKTSEKKATVTSSLAGGKTFLFRWSKPSFPGTIIAGAFQEYKSDEAGIDLHVFFKPQHESLSSEYASTAVKEFTYFITQYSTPPSSRLQVVEIPDDTVPSAYAPEIAAIASRAVSEKVNYRLLANTIAHQWWGVSVTPASKDDCEGYVSGCARL